MTLAARGTPGLRTFFKRVKLATSSASVEAHTSGAHGQFFGERTPHIRCWDSFWDGVLLSARWQAGACDSGTPILWSLMAGVLVHLMDASFSFPLTRFGGEQAPSSADKTDFNAPTPFTLEPVPSVNAGWVHNVNKFLFQLVIAQGRARKQEKDTEKCKLSQNSNGHLSFIDKNICHLYGKRFKV